MRRILKKVTVFMLLVALSGNVVAPLIFNDSMIAVEAHSGRTDANGGHHDYNNVSGLGSYHYHHGYPAHLHPNGVCPYASTASVTAVDTSAQQAQALAAQQAQALAAQQAQAIAAQQAQALAAQQAQALAAQALAAQQAQALAAQQAQALAAQQAQALAAQQAQVLTPAVIMQVQTILNAYGFNCGTPDGVMGLQTQQALINYQTLMGITVDGTINSQVRALLGV